MSKLTPLQQALIVQRLGRNTHGAGIAGLRAAVAEGTHDNEHDEREYEARLDRINSYTVVDFPNDSELMRDDLALLIDAIAQSLGGRSRNDAWRSIGISEAQGRQLLSGRSRTSWPQFFTARQSAGSEAICG